MRIRIGLLPLDAAGVGRAAAAGFDRRRGRHVDLLGDDLLLTAAAAVENIDHCSAIVIATTTNGRCGGI